MISPDGTLDQQYISNYATINVKDVIARLDGVGDANISRAPATIPCGSGSTPHGAGARPDRRGHRRRAAGRQRPGGGRRHQPAAGASAGRVPDRGTDPRPARDARAVRRHRRRDRRRRAGDPHSRHRAGRARRAELHHRTPTWTTRPRPRSASTSGRDRTRSPPRRACAPPWTSSPKSFPAGLAYQIIYNPTDFVQQSIDEVIRRCSRRSCWW